MIKRSSDFKTGAYCVTLSAPLRFLLRLIGKGDRKVAAVFGLSPAACHKAVQHVRQGAPGLPVWLYSTCRPSAETAGICERVQVRRSELALVALAQVELWRHWVAIAVTSWSGERGGWPLKLAPFTIPPFRVLLMNEHGDFFAGRPVRIAIHGGHRLRDCSHLVCQRLMAWLLVAPQRFWSSSWFRRIRHVAEARLLLAASTLLHSLGDPHRKLFRYVAGREPLATGKCRSSGCGIDRFSLGDAGWNFERFSEAVSKSRARWVLWHADGAFEPVQDFLPLFADPRTFAVSWQEHYRGWKPQLLPTAPFRALEAGECCRVLAPLARTILVDRTKLAALGIPHCSLAGTTWMLLFWKAAAAGWLSYSIGHQVPATPQPDLPMEETEFLFHLLARRSLRRLLPSDADLSRGTIARPVSPPHPPRTASTRRPKVLVVSPFLPYPLTHGGAVRIYNLCRALSDRVDFALAAIREQNETVNYEELHRLFGQVYVVDLDERPRDDRRVPKQVRHYESRSLRTFIARLCRDWKPDLLQVEYTQMAAYRDAAPQIPAVLVEHDITFSLYRQFADARQQPDAAAEYERWRSFEAHWLRRYDAVWTMSGEDRGLAIHEGSAPDRTLVVPNGVDTRRYLPLPETAGLEILYIGSFRHSPNVIGFDRLRREIMPLVWERFPQTRLRVVAGPGYETLWHEYAHNGSARIADRRITIHGFVEDLRPLYQGATVVAAPLEVSAGTNIKVLEAMACGRALVVTPIGCAGLGLRDGEDALIRGPSDRFAEALWELLSSPARRSAIAARARATVESRFDWAAIARQAHAGYVALLPAHHSISSSDTAWRGSVNAMEIAPSLLRTQAGDPSSSS